MLPAIRAGLVDSVKPGALTALMLFFVYLFMVSKSEYRMIRCGLFYILGLGLMKCLVNSGLMDALCNTAGFDIFLDVSYFAIALIALGIAAVILRDWWIFKWHQDKSRLLIQFAGRKRGRKLNPPAWLCFLIVLVGNFIAFIESAWPSDAYVYQLVYDLVYAHNLLKGILNFLVYTISYTQLFLLSLILIVFLGNSSLWQSVLQDRLSKVQIVLAGIFMGFGLSLLKYYV